MIVGHKNNSMLRLTAGTPITLSCRADYGDPPFVLTWARASWTTDMKEAPLINENVTINVSHKDGPGMSSDATEENNEAHSNGSTWTNIEPALSGYLTAGTTETSPENNQMNVKENLTNWKTDMTSTPTVGSVNAMTGIVHSTNETTISPATRDVATLTDRTGTEYENYRTHETATIAYEPGWMSDRNDVASTDVRNQTSEKERFEMMKILPGNRYAAFLIRLFVYVGLRLLM